MGTSEPPHPSQESSFWPRWLFPCHSSSFWEQKAATAVCREQHKVCGRAGAGQLRITPQQCPGREGTLLPTMAGRTGVQHHTTLPLCSFSSNNVSGEFCCILTLRPMLSPNQETLGWLQDILFPSKPHLKLFGRVSNPATECVPLAFSPWRRGAVVKSCFSGDLGKLAWVWAVSLRSQLS